MQKVIKIILFITCTFITVSLLFSEYFSEIVEIRKSIFVILKDNKTETITFSKEEWIKISNKDEFEKNGNYYDTKSFSIKDNIIQVVAVKDKMELFLKLISKNSSNKKEQKQNLKKKINLFLTTSLIKIDYFKRDKNKNQVLNLSPFYDKFNLSIFRPPIIL